MDTNEIFWRTQYMDYLSQPYAPSIRYEAWQPGRWAANRAAVYSLTPYLSEIKSSCEVGAGSAAFSFELKKQTGIHIIGIDHCHMAKVYAETISHDMNLNIEYRFEDLFESHVHADLILSLGVIEHYDLQKQREFLKKCYDMSNRYVLVAIPNQESPIFQNYVHWASKESQAYMEDHKPLNTQNLVILFQEMGMSIIKIDGFQVFLSERRFWSETSPDNIAIYQKIKKKLMVKDEKWIDFPCLDFSYSDISVMVQCEMELSDKERIDNGFMTYVLAEKR